LIVEVSLPEPSSEDFPLEDELVTAHEEIRRVEASMVNVNLAFFMSFFLFSLRLMCHRAFLLVKRKGWDFS
jgi:hypothetical protein